MLAPPVGVGLDQGCPVVVEQDIQGKYIYLLIA